MKSKRKKPVDFNDGYKPFFDVAQRLAKRDGLTIGQVITKAYEMRKASGKPMRLVTGESVKPGRRKAEDFLTREGTR